MRVSTIRPDLLPDEEVAASTDFPGVTVNSTAWHNFRADCARYRDDEWLSRHFWWATEPAFWAVAVYRFGQLLQETLPAPLARPVLAAYSLAFTFAQVVTGVELPLSATIGPGLRIYHGNGLVLTGQVVIGDRCTLRHGVTIGTQREGGPSPVLGNDVSIGTQAQVLGGITIGDRAQVGACALVISDVPADSTAVGVPAKVLPRKTSDAVAAN